MWNCFSGFLMVITAGLFWIGIGIAVSKCSAHGWNYNIVQGITYSGAVLICAAVIAGKSLDSGQFAISGFGFAMSCLGGIANFYNYVLTAKAMKNGPNGLVWGIMQSGLIGAFLMGVIFFGERPASVQLIGLLLILCGVLVMGLTKNGKSPVQGKSWVLLSAGALLLCMVTQCFTTLPSFFHAPPETSAISRTFGMYSGGVIGFAFHSLPDMIRMRDFGGRGEWITGGILMVLSTSASLFFFYQGLDMLVKNGCAGLGYPIAIGVCVVGFSLYSLLILKEKFSRLSLAGLAAVCIGIILIALH